MNNNAILSVDWLTIYCVSSSGFDPCCPHSYAGFSYVLKPLDAGSRVFKQLYNIVNTQVHYEETVGVMYTEPRSSAVPKNMVLIKIENQTLYKHSIGDTCNRLCKAFDLTYKGITRLDLCADFLRPVGFKNMQNVISALFNGSAGFRIHRLTFTQYHTQTTLHGTYISGVSFGSPKSRCRSYIYSKTLELLQVKFKPWIVERWYKNNLIDKTALDKINRWATFKNFTADMLSPECEIWRAEISIRSQSTSLISIASGEILKLTPAMLDDYKDLCAVFRAYQAKYLRFTKKVENNANAEVDILPISKETEFVKSCPVNKYKASSKAMRADLTKLQNLLSTYSGESQDTIDSIKTTIRWLKRLFFFQGTISEQLAFINAMQESTHAISSDDWRALYLAILDIAKLYKEDLNPDILYDFARMASARASMETAKKAIEEIYLTP